MSKGRKKNNEIPGSVKDFAEMNYKDYKKENKVYFNSKKELKTDYFSSLADRLPIVIDWLLRNGHIQNPEIQEIKTCCYQRFAGDKKKGMKFIKHITDFVKDGYEIENIQYFPIILHEIIGEILRFNESQKDNPEVLVENPDEMIELYETILKKKLKKAANKNIPEDVMFDLLGVMPDKSAIKYSKYFRIKGVFDIMYRYGEREMLPAATILKFLFNEEDYKFVIGYALQERKEKYKGFNDTQKKLFNDITEWALTELEELPKADIKETLENYINVRKRDAAQGKDGNRRFYLSSLPSTKYENICKVMERIKEADLEADKYL